MTLSDFLVSILVVGIIVLIAYLKISKKTIKDLVIELREITKSMRNK